MDRGNDLRRSSDYRSRNGEPPSYRSSSYNSERDNSYSSSHYSRSYSGGSSQGSNDYHSREPPPPPVSRYAEREDSSYAATAFRGQVPTYPT
ncbi:hypothetical protein G9A89_000460, partial [Geosiphon pyriformis]